MPPIFHYHIVGVISALCGEVHVSPFHTRHGCVFVCVDENATLWAYHTYGVASMKPDNYGE